MAAVHPGGAGTFRTAGKLWQDSLESHEVSGRGECGELHFQIYSTSDRTLMSRSGSSVEVYQLRRQQVFLVVLQGTAAVSIHGLRHGLQVEGHYFHF